ncbi:MAG TPA: ABC transporter permease [Bacteroidales bacterium]|nr:ABC transporter permease [Bacteroidales bacterium]HRZ48168.1 ABC transporter permease [Bacteroidales bacterium]
MKRFLGFVRKEFLHIFRDPLTMIIIFGIPAVQILLFGFVVSTDLKETKVAFLDLSKDEITRTLSGKICSSGFFELGADLTGYHEAEHVLRKNKIKAVIVFEKDFGRRLISDGTASVHIIADGSEPNMATLITSHISAIIADYNRELAGAGLQQVLLVQPEVRMFYNPTLKGQFMFVPGVITLIMLLICALMTSITITREKEFGTMEVLLVSPLRPAQIILGKVLPYFILSFVDVILILLLSWFVFELPVKGSLALLLAELMLYILMSLSLGILISTVAKNMQQAIFISLVGMMLPTVLLSGFIIPVESMPMPYQWVSKILPPAYFITIIKNIMIKGTGFLYVWKETLFLLVFTLAAIGLSIRNFKIRLQ